MKITKVNKFEQISSDGHQMSSEVLCPEGVCVGEGGPCTVRSHV